MKTLSREISTALALMFLIFSPILVIAQVNSDATPPSKSGVNSNGLPPSQTVSTLQNPLKATSIGGVVNTFTEIFSYIVVLIGVLALIWVGFQFILARGEPKRLSELKGWLLYIVVGVAIVIGARIIIQVVINTLEATGTVSPQVINSAQNALHTQ